MRAATLIALAAAAAFAACTPKAPKLQEHTGRRTVVITDEVLRSGATDTVRFGRLNAGEKGLASLVLHNATDRPVVIVHHDISCNCTSVSYQRSPIMPGSENTIDFTFDSSGEFGWQFKLVKFRLSDSEEPLRIFVEADVK